MQSVEGEKENLGSNFWITLSSLIFLSEAFRYRILLLLIPIGLLWLFYYKRRPKLVLLLACMLLFIGSNGAISIARTSIRGIDVASVARYSPVQIFTSSFEEAGVFFTTSAVIERVPRLAPFTRFDPS